MFAGGLPLSVEALLISILPSLELKAVFVGLQAGPRLDPQICLASCVTPLCQAGSDSIIANMTNGT